MRIVVEQNTIHQITNKVLFAFDYYTRLFMFEVEGVGGGGLKLNQVESARNAEF